MSWILCEGGPLVSGRMSMQAESKQQKRWLMLSKKWRAHLKHLSPSQELQCLQGGLGLPQSAGYYKPDPVKEYTEESPGGDHDFLAKLCTKWEAAAKLPPEVKCRTVTVRSGVVLGSNGGMVQQLYWPFFLGLGGPVASGTQFMPWVHISDIVGILIHAMSKEGLTGVLNGVAPQIVTNAEFTKEFARAMWRPALFPLPKFVLDLAFSPERATMMTEGQKVIPKRTLESGYKYKFPDVQSACQDVLQRK
ncbi:epimerase family protein SDR39U1 isoform X5 [Dermacentor variabilis]|uniref:epimerase family protein SDR39U1 isoform X5 n=1 Tax=Dermacentor variabilis TaxID=34621 RepID=UPI003F5C3DB4